MKIDAILPPAELDRVGELAREAEALGFSGLLVPEASHDPFLALTLAAEHTAALEIGAFVAALPRSPMHLAQVSHDLQTYCGGRLTLGLGTEDRQETEQRFGIGWSKPAARMREIVLALRAIWRAWNEGAPLCFQGEFYRHTLMTPAFDPGPTGWGPPRVFLAAGGAEMAEVAGEVADGLFVAGSAGEGHLGDVVLPALERGLRRSGRSRADVEVCVPLPGGPGPAPELGDQLHRYSGALPASLDAYRDLADRIALPIC